MKEDIRFTFRPIKHSDSKSLYELSKEASGGLSNLPKTLAGVKTLIQASNDSFLDKVSVTDKRFTFVIENAQKTSSEYRALKPGLAHNVPIIRFY